jgi:ABC-type molybdate transport system permease subunit
MIKSPVQPKDVYRRVASLLSQVGCMTIFIVLVAGFLGRWLDAQFNTGRTITLWLILGSFPLTLLLMFFLVRLSIKSIKKETEQLAEEANAGVNNKEEEVNGTET